MKSLSFLKELMKVDSSNSEGANYLIDYAAAYLETHEIKGDIIENNGYKSYVSVLGSGDYTLVLNGHLDVVSGKPRQFEPREEDGRLYGRGSADMKSGCAAMIHAFIKLKDMNPQCRVMLQLVTDEEIGGVNCSKYLAESGYVGDFVICTEPTQMLPSIQSKGMIKLDIEVRGIAAHGSRPWEGNNAIVNAYRDYDAIRALPILSEGSEFYDCSTVNLALIKGGDIYNRVPDSCVMGLDIRYVPHVDPMEIIKAIKSVISGEATLISLEPGVLVKPDNPYITELVSCLKDTMPNHPVKIVGQHGGSDARFFAARGIPAIELGPSGDFWHGDGEYVEIQSVRDLETILVDFAMRFASIEKRG